MRIVDEVDRNRAASELETNLVVVAGAGTGKTSLLIERVLHHILERGTPLERVVAMTFTEKAAAEMRERLEDALETAIRVLSSGGGWPGRETGLEARRVLERMGELDPAVLRQRAVEAIEARDRARISTIHSFSAELLRRHAAEAGVDPDFAVDRGDEAETLFGELWSELVMADFGRSPDARRLSYWRILLEKLTIEDVERIAMALCAFRLPLEVLESEEAATQREHLVSFAGRRLQEARGLADEIAGLEGVNPHFVANLERLATVFSRVIDDGFLPTAEWLAEIGLPASTPTIGKRASVTDRKELEDRHSALLRDVRDLAKVDLQLTSELARVLVPLVRSFRSEFLARGWISFDSMILLARDLLRDHPRVRREEAERIDHLLIDEFQDTDPLQYEVAFLLAARPGESERAVGPGASTSAYELDLEPGKLFIVGDPKQSIYRFRGADIEAYERAVRTIERNGGRQITLRTNFRSVPGIVAPLNRLFTHVFGSGSPLDPEFQPLSGFRSGGGAGRIEIWTIGEPPCPARERRRQEADAIADHLRLAVDRGDMACRDAAILLRALTDVETLLRALAERGIPFVAEGSKGFYVRHEVALLVALLRAVVSPADPVPLVSWLRSPAAGVPDHELQRYAEHLRSVSTDVRRHGDLPWSMELRPEVGSFPCLAGALADLRGFRDRHRGRDLASVARAATQETPLLLAMAASHGGAQRVVNLEKAVRRIDELGEDGKLSPEEVLQRLEREADRRQEGDSPLADESVDAVQVLSVHRAKGLEWPVVILPDLARGARGGRPDGSPGIEVADVPVSEHLPPALALGYRGRWSAAWPGHRELAALHDEAESRRLLYVAMTRARDRLVVLAGHARTGAAPWLDALEAWGYRQQGGVPADAELLAGDVIHRRVAVSDGARGADRRDDVVPDPVLLEAARSCELAVSRLGKGQHATIHNPAARADGSAPSLPSDRDALDDEVERPADRRGSSDASREAHRQAAILVGSGLHLLLERWDGRDPRWLLDHAGRAVQTAAGADCPVALSVVDRLRGVLERADRSGELERWSSLRILGRETPILFRDEDGVIWEGRADLITGSPGSPEIHDYKTGSSRSLANLGELHAAQVRRYAQGLRRALGPGDEIPARLWSFPEGERS